MALSYNVSLYILLLHSMIDIAIMSYSLCGVFLAIVGLLTNMAFVVVIFRGFLLGLSSFARTFFFIEGVLSRGHLVNSFASFSDLSMYSTLAMTTCLVCRA